MTNVTVKSGNNTVTINTNEVTSMKLSTIKQELTAQFTVEKKVVVAVEKTRVAGKKGKKGSRCHSKIKRTPIYETKMVVNEAALNKAAKEILAAELIEAKEAAKAAFHARNAERAPSALRERGDGLCGDSQDCPLHRNDPCGRRHHHLPRGDAGHGRCRHRRGAGDAVWTRPGGICAEPGRQRRSGGR